MAANPGDLGQDFEFKNIQDIDLLSDFQVEPSVSNSNSSNVIMVDNSQAGQLGITGDGNYVDDGQEIHMILNNDSQGFQTIQSQNELHDQVLHDFADDIVFDNVASEVSIVPSASESQQNQRQTLTIPRLTKGIKTITLPKATPTKTISNQPTQQIIIPVSSQGAGGAGLAQFITSIKPPVIPGTSMKPKPVTMSPVRMITTTNTVQSRKPTSIAPAPGNVFKYVMTTSGQQLLISSPIKMEDGTEPKIVNIPSSGTTLTTSTGQQVVFLSPAKGGTPQKLVQVRPKPNISQSPVRVAVSSASFQQGLTTRTQDGKPVQIVKIMSVAGGNSTASVSGLGKAGLRPIAPSTNKLPTSIATSIATALTSGQKLIIPSSSLKGGNVITSLAGSTSSSGAFMTTGPGGAQVIMLPANLLQTGHGQTVKLSQMQPQYKAMSIVAHPSGATSRTNFIPIAPSPLSANAIIPSAKEVLAGLSSPKVNGKAILEDANRQRKPCNCTKSQCLKLYCDCFANGEFCNGCNCNNCFNNLEHEEDRQKAIKMCLERNPHAFHPKIGKGRGQGDVAERRHTKGCNCRRSGCLKNYCECYEAKILCSELCKCCGCKNYEDSFERKTLMHLADAAEVRSAQQTAATKTKWWGSDFVPKLPIQAGGDNRLPCAFITNEVIDAACQCLLATAENGEKKKLPYEQIEKLIIEEFGRCLEQIIDCANTTKSNDFL
ncbi:Protein lin-54 -like protein [Halotydeus destructor]|nr:Protein lin-54 -like protein [Halotydeus destructor]